MKKTHFYVCPVCGNIITSVGEGLISCCGISLPVQEAEDCTDEHNIVLDTIEDEYYITLKHPMTKQHYISFIAYVTSDNVEIVKLYSEQDISVRLKKRGHGIIYVYCNRDGMFKKIVYHFRQDIFVYPFNIFKCFITHCRTYKIPVKHVLNHQKIFSGTLFINSIS